MLATSATATIAASASSSNAAASLHDSRSTSNFVRDMTVGRRLKQHEAYDSRGSLKFHADKRDYDVPRYKCVALPEATGMSSNVPSATKCPPGKVPAALLHVQTRTEPTFQYFYDGLDLDSAYLQKTGIVEPALSHVWIELAARCCKRPRAHVVDVGANFGWYTLLSLALGCHVIAFEPIPTYANILALGLRRNPGFAARTTLHRAVVAEEAGRNFTVKVPIANPLSGWLKHLGMTSMVGEHGLIKGFPDNWMHFNVSSPSVHVDDVVPPDVPVCMLKADVEGYEPAVLRTAERLLSSGRVHAVQLEVTTSPDRRVASETVEALAHLETLGFTVRQLPRRMDNNGSATFDSLPAFPSARAVAGCKKARSPLAGTPLAETPFGRAYHCDINTFSTNLVARHRQHHGRNASSVR